MMKNTSTKVPSNLRQKDLARVGYSVLQPSSKLRRIQLSNAETFSWKRTQRGEKLRDESESKERTGNVRLQSSLRAQSRLFEMMLRGGSMRQKRMKERIMSKDVKVAVT